MQKKLQWFTDVSHGWLAVPYSELVELKITDKISKYSYRKNHTVFLEEDVDAGIYLKALEKLHPDIGYLPNESYSHKSHVRNYPSYYKG